MIEAFKIKTKTIVVEFKNTKSDFGDLSKSVFLDL